MKRIELLMKENFLTKSLRRIILFGTILAFAAVFFGAVEARKTMSNRVVDWLPAGFEETRDFYWYLGHFREGGLLMASWDGCSPHDPRLSEAAERLMSNGPDGSPPLYEKVISSDSIFREMTAEPMALDTEDAYARMEGWILSKDHRQGCMVAFYSPEGNKNAPRAIDRLYDVLAETFDLDRSDIHLAGSSLDSVAIDAASKKSQDRILPFFLLACVVILFVLLRSALAVFVVFTAAIFNEEMSIAAIYYTGGYMDSVSLLISSLLFVLTISGSLHLLNYYRDLMERTGKPGAALGAVKKAFLPCALACLTTVLGLFSLTVSRVVPIRNFGVYATASLILGTLFFILYIPSFIEDCPILAWRTKRTEIQARNPFLARFSFERLWNWYPEMVRRHRNILVAVSLLLLASGFLFLPKLKTTITFHGMFPKDAPVILDYDYLESRIGGLVPIEVIVNIPKAENEKAGWVEQISLLERIEDELRALDETESAVSALNFIPYLPDVNGSGFSATAGRSIFNKMMDSRVSALEREAIYDGRTTEGDRERNLPESHRWRISLRVPSNAGIQYGPLLERIGATVRRVIGEEAEPLGMVGVTAVLTGGVPLAHKAQKQLLSDLTASYISAFVMILLTLICLLRGFVSGVIAMIPNIFPSATVFGAMAAFGIPVDMGMMMTASVALGISVDGTIHFLTWYKQGLADGKSQEEAVKFAYRECGTAMVQATLICGGGMLIFVFSNFLPISRFAWMMAILLTIALFGDLALFPALLNGPVGRFFSPRRRKK